MSLTLVVRSPSDEIQTQQLARNSTLHLAPGDTVVLPADFAGRLEVDRPAPGDLTLTTPTPGSITVVLRGFAAAISTGDAALKIGALRVGTLAELLDTIATATGGEAASGDQIESGGSSSVPAFVSEPLGGTTKAVAGPPPPPGEPGKNALASGAEDDASGPPSAETRFASLFADAGAQGPAGQASVTAAAATGLEDTSIALSIQATVAGAFDQLTVVVSGLPDGAVLSAGTALGGGLWALDASMLAGLTLTPAPNDDGNLTLAVTAIATLGARQSIATVALPVTVIPAIDRLFTPGDDIVDLSTLPDMTRPNPLGGPWAEDGNIADAGEGNDVVRLASGGPNLLPPGIVFRGGAGDDTIFGGSANDTITGGAGRNDTLVGGGGDDAIILDFLQGETVAFSGPIGAYAVTREGNDIIVADLVAGRDGTDRLIVGEPSNIGVSAARFGSEDFTLFYAPQSLTGASFGFVLSNYLAIGNDGNNQFSFESSFAQNLNKFYAVGAGGNDTLSGGSNTDYLFGDDGSDTLDGRASDDYLDGGAGSDTLTGGGGNDTFIGGGGDDLLMLQFFEMDTAIFTGPISDYRLSADDPTLVVADQVAGRDGTDRVEGQVFGFLTPVLRFAGVDFSGTIVTGSASGTTGFTTPEGGNYFIVGDDFRQRLEATGAGTHYLAGGGGDDSLIGGSGTDYVFGGDGNDILTGRAGGDTIEGGAGNDAIRYTAIADAGDTILNFEAGQDIIDLDALFDSLGVATADRTARTGLVDQGGGQWLLSVDADGDAANGFEVGLAAIASADQITVGQDIQLGQL